MSEHIPSQFWSALTVLSLLGWIAAAAGLIWRGFHPEGSFSARRGRGWVITLALFYILWIVSVGSL